MTRVDAELLDGERIVFTARGRSLVNAREMLPDGPIGFTSGELLLIALANCSLGILTHHDLLKDVPIRRCRAVLEGEMLSKPARLDDIKVVIELEVDDPGLLDRRETLERAADRCPIGNTLKSTPSVSVELRLVAPERETAPAS